MNTNLPLYNPPHPGEFITQIYVAPSGVSVRELAKKLRVSASTLSRLLAASHRVSPEMALRLSKVLGRSPESWLAMQDSYDLWQARARINVDELEPLTLTG
jgi:antitoxin HigA-1